MLEIDGTLIVAVISFIIFTIVMNIIFYRPIMNVMQERESLVELDNDRAKKNLEDKQALQEQKESELRQAQLDATKLIVESIELATKDKNGIVQSAALDAKLKVEQLKSSLQKQQSELQLSGQINDIATDILTKVLPKGGQNA